MTEHQIHYGKKFYLDKKTGYWISTACPKIRAHVWVWKHHHNLVPKGWHVHHRDGDKSNNAIENLTIMSVANHMKHHHDHYDDSFKKKQLDHCEKIRPLTKAWHASPEGIAWHRLHAIKSNFGNGPAFDYECQQCFKPYQSKRKSVTRFCSNACKSMWRRKNQMDDINKECPVCHKTYRSSKYARAKSCGVICGQRLRQRKV